jgi:hypothetical protein
MIGMCYLIGQYADRKARERRERAQDPEGAPLMHMEKDKEPAADKNDAEQKRE